MTLNLALIVALAVLHASGGKLGILDRVPRRIWLSFTGGVAIAYVFVEILPGLSEAQEALETAAQLLGPDGMRDVYLLGLLGLTIFYGLELLATESRRASRSELGADRTGTGVFWLHIGSFAIYNALFSFLLNHTRELLDCLLLFVAVALHYVGNDHTLREHHKEAYDGIGRWVLAGAILAGWAAAQLVPATDGGGPAVLRLAMLKAFLAGGLILNVLKTEVPGRAESSFPAFVAGAGVYAALILLV